MKILFLLFAFVGTLFSAQIRNDLDWQKMDPNERRALIQKMSPDERMQLLKQYKENMIFEELDIPENKQEEFKKLFREYQDSQKAIREQFKADFKTENMTDAEARKNLEQSFLVGQQLLDNRKKYAEKFQKILTPQQVLKLFQSEGRMREKMLERRGQGNGKPDFGPPRNDHP